jgi:hypothetical protein
VLLESVDRGEGVTLAAVWQAIETVVSRADLRAAVDNIAAVTPPRHADPGGEWRTLLVERCPLVRRFLTRLCTAIEFEATAEAGPVLQALLELPGVLDGRATMRVPTGYLDARQCGPVWCRLDGGDPWSSRQSARGQRRPSRLRLLRTGAFPSAPPPPGHLRRLLEPLR